MALTRAAAVLCGGGAEHLERYGRQDPGGPGLNGKLATKLLEPVNNSGIRGLDEAIYSGRDDSSQPGVPQRRIAGAGRLNFTATDHGACYRHARGNSFAVSFNCSHFVMHIFMRQRKSYN